MHQALLLVATAIVRAHDQWRERVGRRRSLSGKIAVLEERVARLEAESALLRARFLRVPPRRRPHYRRHEPLSILWHAARYRLSVENLAEVFVVTQQTILNWRRVMHRKDPHLLPPLRGLPELVHDLVHRLKTEWPQWGTRRIAGQLARLGGRYHPVIWPPEEVLEDAFRRRFLRALERAERLRPETRARLLSWRHSGFSVKATQRVASTERGRLARLARYATRVVVAVGAMGFREDGRVEIETPPDPVTSSTVLVLDRLELVHALCQQVPDKGMHLVRYYGT